MTRNIQARPDGFARDIHPDDHIFRFVEASVQDRAKAEREYFKGGADAADWLRRMIATYRPVDEPFELLEFAAGYGRVSRHLPSALPAARVTASDIHQEAIDFLQRLDVEAAISSATPETFHVDKSFDVVFALSFFTHMPRSSWTRWLRALLRHLKPGGCIIMTTHGVPGMNVMRASQPGTVEWDADGFWFAPISEQGDLDTAEYGSTGTSFGFVNRQIESSGASLFHFQERGAGYQDVYIIRQREAADAERAPATALVGTQPRRAAPREVTDPKDCLFYHSMDVPGVGQVDGQWDLRGSEDDCLGGLALDGLKVLEVGPASGYLTFWMERQGAKVTVYDLDDNVNWDLVPFQGMDPTREHAARRGLIRKVNNAWWLSRRAFGSDAECFYGTAYDIDESVGMFDVVAINSVLLHVRDPLRVIERAASRTRDAIVITEVSEHQFASGGLKGGDRSLHFIPDAAAGGPVDGWWYLPSTLVSEYLDILGFETVETRHFKAKFQGGHHWDLYTTVAKRRVRLD